jgi:hypothetical protein
LNVSQATPASSSIFCKIVLNSAIIYLQNESLVPA